MDQGLRKTFSIFRHRNSFVSHEFILKAMISTTYLRVYLICIIKVRVRPASRDDFQFSIR